MNRFRFLILLVFLSQSRKCDAFSSGQARLSLIVRPGPTSSSTAARSKSNNPQDIVVERPDPSILLSAQSDSIQKIGFVAICASLALGTAAMVEGLTLLETVLPDGWYAAWRDYTWSLPLGATLVLAGISHFALSDTFTAFVPPPGTWGGLWQVPAPGSEKLGLTYQQYHAYWTGLAEIGGGTLLVLGGFPFYAMPVQIPAFLLFLLVVAITPSNIYMATHDVQVPRLPPLPYPEGHVFRGVLQCFLLAILWKLTVQ